MSSINLNKKGKNMYNLSRTQPFYTYQEFLARPDKTVNGYFADRIKPNLINCFGCWDCENCTNCIDCISCDDCTNSSSLDKERNYKYNTKF